MSAEEIANIFWNTYHATNGDWNKAANAAAHAMQGSDLTYGVVKAAIARLMSDSKYKPEIEDWITWALAHYTMDPLKEEKQQ